MARDWGVAGDLALMAFGAVMVPVSAMAMLMLTLALYFGPVDGGFQPVAFVAIAAMLVLGVWNLMDAIRLVNRPEGRRAAAVACRSLVALASFTSGVTIFSGVWG